ncbi:MAG TPA: GNAT family N-acetyltransferase [Acidimicrobiales bacterium]|nr:GNAT family N-acetyltransferase [Acidimicrobiales bacterium]
MIRVLATDEVDAVGRVLGLARLFQGDGEYLIAWDVQEPVGHVHVARSEPPELQDLEVREGYRRRGVATALLAAAEADCAAHGASRVRVTVSVDNDVAHRLYAARGYADAGLPPRRVQGTIQVRTGPIDVDDTLLTLEKRLS